MLSYHHYKKPVTLVNLHIMLVVSTYALFKLVQKRKKNKVEKKVQLKKY